MKWQYFLDVCLFSISAGRVQVLTRY